MYLEVREKPLLALSLDLGPELLSSVTQVFLRGDAETASWVCLLTHHHSVPRSHCNCLHLVAILLICQNSTRNLNKLSQASQTTVMVQFSAPHSDVIAVFQIITVDC